MGPSQTPVTSQTCFSLLDESREADGHAAAELSYRRIRRVALQCVRLAIAAFAAIACLATIHRAILAGLLA